ncbi:hypothetical protein HYW72_01445 [Candidatus Nomurabacteria bacterium]|nr:hypothetical protein [Candidatus Nomurabacteria bacterium]
MKSKEAKPSEVGDNKTTPEAKLTKQEILDLIEKASHQTWMRQAHRDKGTNMDKLSQAVSDGDRERAADAWKELEKEKPKTRAEAVTLLARRSHEMWLAHKRVLVSTEEFDLNPNDHDRERAEDIIKALEVRGVLSYGE